MLLAIRRDFLKLLAIGGASFGTGALSWRTAAAEQTQGNRAARGAPDFKKIKGLAFDAYGTLFDVHSVIALGEQLFPGQGTALSNTWRLKQLQYTWGRSLMGRYEDFWKVTEDGLVFAAKSLKIDGLLSRIISVDEIKIYKPSPRVYELAPKRLETAAQAIGFVSSNSWDVAGAASFGLTTFWINRGKQPMDEL